MVLPFFQDFMNMFRKTKSPKFALPPLPPSSHTPEATGPKMHDKAKPTLFSDLSGESMIGL